MEISSKLLGGLEPDFEKRGFRLNKKKREFIRDVNGCTQIVDLFFFKKGNSIVIKPEIRIKVERIESIYKSITKIKDRPYLTLGNHLFDILRYMEKGMEKGLRNIPLSDWLVKDERDINKLIEVIPEYFEETIIPYFDSNSSISRVDELLNKYPRELSVHNYLYPLRSNIAIIAAKLNDNPEYEKLVEIYEEELEEAEETYKEDFYKLKENLKNVCENN
ncbi:hypothetical protein [Psychroserpens sp. SPM9]|uniref:hypothetical protein n=1 Tax=Psychroserpens sp. SPM9 TaxID=2975598 RepID=UPI0021A2EA4E|nr:hypothetical protein [Psychroserpens sp. SPM9]MDG5490632.1 hypothetical protein [Psychroserpens sp. SPM9]MDG5490638.1 hypothetical protein [Psychroserpens sp. SPM9]